MAQSGTVSPGSAILASQYNDLRDDVLSISLGHQHTGASEDGQQIPTAGIEDGAITAVKIANRVRQFFVPALYAWNVTDGAFLDMTGYAGWRLKGNKVCRTYGFFYVPSDLSSGLNVRALGRMDGGGTVVWQHDASWGAVGEIWQNAYTIDVGTAALGASVEGGYNTLIGSLSLSAAGTGDYMNLYFTRDGTDPESSLSDAFSPGWLVEYIADC